MGPKRRIRSAIYQCARLTGMLALAERRMSRGLTALMYHRVLPDDEANGYPLSSLAMPRSAFQGQVAWLAEHARVLPLGPAFEELAAGRAADGDKPLVALTFDDGYRDNVEIAAPILEDAGLRGTFYITAGIVADDEMMWFDRAAMMWVGGQPAVLADLVAANSSQQPPELATIFDWMATLKALAPAERAAVVAAYEPSDADRARFRMMTPADVRTLNEKGHEIGSHTITHPLLSALSEAEIDRELSASKLELQDWIGADVPGFCYPNGDHDERVVETAKATGYRYACSVAPGRNDSGIDPFRLRRFDITPRRVATPDGRHDNLAFRCEISGLREVGR